MIERPIMEAAAGGRVETGVHCLADRSAPRREDGAGAKPARDGVSVECKWKPEAFEARGLGAFRQHYPQGRNYVVCPLTSPGYERVQDGLKLAFVSPGELRQAMTTWNDH